MKKSLVTIEIICIVFMIVNIFLIIMDPMHKVYEPTISHEELNDFSDGWTYADGSKADLEKLSSDETDPDDGSICTYHHLNADYYDRTLMFRSKGINFSVYLGNTLIYYYSPPYIMSSGKSYGSSFHFIKLPHSNFEKMLEIKIYPIHDDLSGLIDYTGIGDTGHYIYTFIKMKLFPFSMSMLIFMLGLIITIISFLIKLQEKTRNGMRNFGLLGVMVGVFSAFSTLIPQILFGHSTMFHAIEYVLLIFLPYPIICYVCTILNLKKFYSNLICAIVLIDYTILSTLNYLGISDFHENHMMFHSVILITILLIFALIIYNRKSIDFKKGVFTSYIVWIGFIITLITSLIDLTRYLMRSTLYDYTTFLRIGFLIFITMVLIKYIAVIQQETKLVSTTQLYRKLAFTDILTGLGNRAAFSKKESKLGNKLAEGEITEILCCQLDLNDLKLVNDGYGHATGDKLIKSAASIIKQAFKDEGVFYRVGGDEFTIFISGDNSEERYNACLKTMFELEKESESEAELPIPISFAYGMAMYKRNESSKPPKDGIQILEKIEKEADLAMYRQKKIMKKNAHKEQLTNL